MIDAQSMTIQKLIVSVRRMDDPAKEFSWPYEHVPRVGEKFLFGDDGSYVVKDVEYNFVDGGAFHAVVHLRPG